MSTIKANRVENLTTTDGGISINNSGNVGIGTSSPSELLTVGDSENTDSYISVESANNTEAGIKFYSDSTAAKGYNVGYEGDGNLFFIREDDSGTVTDRFVIDDSGKVGIGNSSPQVKLDVGGTVTAGLAGLSNSVAYFGFNQSSNLYSGVALGAGVNGNTPFIAAAQRGDGVGLPLVFYTDGAERMRIHSGGEITVGTNSVNPGVGNTVYGASINNGYISASRDNPVAYFNRPSNDGILVEFLQAGTNEGQIVVTGTSVTYGGGHLARWSQLTDADNTTGILRGTVLSNLDEMCEWGDEDNEQLNRTKISDVEGDPNVAGVFVAYDTEDEVYTDDFYCAMTGDFIIRIAQGTTVARGDLLMSAGDGTAKPQDDDIVRSKTVAKVTSTVVSETYADGSYCVPCVLMAC